MTTAKQKKRNRAYQHRVKADFGGKRCFGVKRKACHEFGVFAFAASRGLKNGRPIF